MSERFVCIHGHFYQPPRENAWLESVELQDSAYPNHDWNERICDECYGPNARARVLDDQGWIVAMINNYAHMSFNFGPTLLAWLEHAEPDAYARVIDADRESMERFSGHGSAIAQAYNHLIMPLCHERDRQTQVIWGIRDFVRRFGRRPEGMWLPETAANTSSLEVLAEHGIKFTILAPRQAARVRPIGDGDWEDVGGQVDPSMPYLCRLPSGREIALFFYDGPISQAVAFEGLLHSGERFATRIMEAFDDRRTRVQLAHIATDGETYGHHHRHGEMALASALQRVVDHRDVRLTNYAEFLSLNPPTHEAQIVEDSSWSCVHGVGRWMTDCGCHSGAHSDWHQRWRGPLRAALDWLRDSLADVFEKEVATMLRDPWEARNAYIDIVCDRSPATLQRFFDAHASKSLDDAERIRVLRFMELQRHAMLMYTSCGWFFDDISGIETVQVIQYAARVIQLAQKTANLDLEPEFLTLLEKAEGNVHTRKNGKQVYLQCVKPAAVDLPRVGAHYAISSLFESYPESATLFCYEVRREHASMSSAGRARLCIGRASVASNVTMATERFSYGALHLGDHVVNCGVRQFQGDDAYAELVRVTQDAFDRADFAEVLRQMDRAFGSVNYSIASLFRDEQHRVVRRILEPTLQQVDASYAQIYEQHAPLARFLRRLDLPVPRRLQLPARFVLNQLLRRELSSDAVEPQRIRPLLAEAENQGVDLEARTLAYAVEETLERKMRRITASTPLEELAALRLIVEFTNELPFDLDLWQVQDEYYERRHTLMPELQGRSRAAAAPAARWTEEFFALGEALKIRGT